MKNTDVKYTKAAKYADLETILSQVSTEDFDIPTLIEFVQAEAAALGRKADKAKAKAAEKKSETDELCDAVFAKLTNDPMTRDQIAEMFDDSEITPAKVGARLNKLVALGRVVKGEMAATSAAGKKTTRMVYSLPSDEVGE